MMKKISGVFLLAVLLLALSACGKSMADQWQEQYDLGQKYLLEEDYEAAIVAFTAAIEIEPNEAAAYVGRGDAYVLLDRTEENLQLAMADYETALDLDETIAAAYLGMADVYIRQGESESAIEVLNKGLEKTGGDETISDMLSNLDSEESGEQETATDISAETEKLETDEQSEDKIYNSYGAVEFSYRDEYCELENFSEEERDYIETIASAALNMDVEEMAEIAGLTGISNYTVWNDYKVHISDWSDGSQTYVEIFLRPENGMGYYYLVNNKDSFSTETTEFSLSTLSYVYITCPCVDWQWEGDFYEEEYIYITKTWVNGRIETSKDVTTVTGTMKNNLREGIFNAIRQTFDNDNLREETSSYSVYVNGVQTEFNGESQNGESIYSISDSLYSGGMNYQEILDALFW